MNGSPHDLLQASLLGRISGWEGIIILAVLAGLVSVINRIIDAWSNSRKARLDLEKEYLRQMVDDIEEIKQRLRSPDRR